MQKVRHYTIRKESFEEMCNSGRFNPCLEIVFEDSAGCHTHKISAGYEDDISVYHDNGETYVLSQNPRLDYAGLEVFGGDERIAHLFVSGDGKLAVLGKNGLTQKAKIERLNEYIY